MKKNEAVKYDSEKLLRQLIPPSLHRAVAVVFTYGSKKYAPRNWEKGTEWGRYYRAAMGHLEDFWEGKDFDDDTGLPTLWHAACCLTILIEYFECHLGTDDRARRERTDFSERIKAALVKEQHEPTR